MPRSRRRSSAGKQLRIIGGRWRGRKLGFTPAAGLRPTTDRVRETLFNWLAADLQGARCADLFAGSGALGLEALSRGAAHCDFVDTSGTAIRDISEHLHTLEATSMASLRQVPALQAASEGHRAWDIVFLDPPFRSDLAGPLCQALAAPGALAPAALLYLESGADEALPALPTAWRLLREKRAGGVLSRLFAAP